MREAEQLGKDLSELPVETLKSFSPLIEEDAYAALRAAGSVAARNHVGGTSGASAGGRRWEELRGGGASCVCGNRIGERQVGVES